MDNRQNRRPESTNRRPAQSAPRRTNGNQARRPSPEAVRRAQEREKRRKQARLLRILAIVLCVIVIAIVVVIAVSCSKKKNRGSDEPVVQPTTEEVVTLPEKSTVELIAVGDVLMHTPLLNYADNGDGTYDFNSIFAVMKDDISRADIAVCNQETPVDPYSDPDGGIHFIFNTPTEIVDAEINAGFDGIYKDMAIALLPMILLIQLGTAPHRNILKRSLHGE
ncbi:MAG: CapA family protein, partial [Parasporobacterium sp.]|nr:CapA family protein [Parasporobacterium sp.]